MLDLFPTLEQAQILGITPRSMIFFYGISLVTFTVFYLGWTLAFIELGWVIGNRYFRLHDKPAPHETLIVTALLALMGLIIGFTYGTTMQRQHYIRDAIVEESERAGTAYLRTYLVDNAVAGEVRNRIREYVRMRAHPMATMDRSKGVDWQKVAEYLQKENEILAAVWPLTLVAIQEAEPPVRVAILNSVNAFLDSTEKVVTGKLNRMSTYIFVMMLVLIALSVFSVGRYHGKTQSQDRWQNWTLIFAIVLMMGTLTDVDRFHEGFIQVDDGAMERLYEYMK